MALILASGAELGGFDFGTTGASGGAGAGLEGQNNVFGAGTAVIDKTVSRSGVASFKNVCANGDSVGVYRTQSGGWTALANTLWVQWAVMYQTLPSSAHYHSVMFEGGSLANAVQFNGSNQPVLLAWVAGSQTTVGSPGTALTANTWCTLTLAVTIPSTGNGSISLYQNGSLVAQNTSIALANTVLSEWDLGVYSNGTGSSQTNWVDDVLIWDSTGSAFNTLAAASANTGVYYSLPVSDNSTTGFTEGGGGTGSLFDAVNNQPPVGVAQASATNTSQVKRESANTTDNYSANMQSLSTLGLSSATINAIQPIASIGSSSTTAITEGISTTANPVIAQVATASLGAAAGTWPTNWKTIKGTLTYSPTISGTPVMKVVKTTSSSSVYGMVAFMGLLLVATPPSVVNGSASMAAAATLTANGIVVVAGASSQAAAATLTAAGAVTNQGAASLTAAGSLVAAGTARVVGAASMTAAATLTAVGSARLAGSVSMTAVATATAGGTAILAGTASQAATGALTAAGSTTVTGSVSGASTATLTAAATQTNAGQASVAATGSLTAAGSSSVHGTGSLSATGSLTSAAVQTNTGSSSLAATGTVTVAGSSTQYGSASLTAVATQSANGTASSGPSASFGATTTMVAVGGTRVPGTAALAATGTLAATANDRVSGTATFAATGTLTVTGSSRVAGTATLTAAGSLTASAGSAIVGSATLAATSSATVAGAVTAHGTASLAAIGSLVVAGAQHVAGGASLAALVSAAATGVVSQQGAASLTATGTLQAAAIEIGNLPHAAGIVNPAFNTGFTAPTSRISAPAEPGSTQGSVNPQSTIGVSYQTED